MKILLILLCLPMIGFGQQMTYVPDDNFEQALIDLGYDILLDDSVMTGELQMILTLYLSNLNISDLTGIEECISLIYLNCGNNQLTTLDVSQSTSLNDLYCDNNQLTFLDISQNTHLDWLDCGDNQLTSLDVSQNTVLTYLQSDLNLLFSLDLRNGNNTNLVIEVFDNPNLTCINVDDTVWSNTNWTSIDSQHYFSNNCPSTTDLQEHTTNKELLKVTDLLGREKKQINQPLFYLYDDGTVEKRIVIE